MVMEKKKEDNNCFEDPLTYVDNLYHSLDAFMGNWALWSVLNIINVPYAMIFLLTINHPVLRWSLPDYKDCLHVAFN